MNLRIDRARIPQGLIQSAKTYVIVLDDKGVYLLHIGPAPGTVVRPKNSVEKVAINYALDRVEKKIREGESALANSTIEAWVQQKRSAFYPVRAISNARLDTNYAGENRLRFVANGKKWKFMIPPQSVETARALVERLGGRSSVPN